MEDGKGRGKGAGLNDACTLAKEFFGFCCVHGMPEVCMRVYVVCVVLTASAGASERCFWPANRNPFGCKAARPH